MMDPVNEAIHVPSPADGGDERLTNDPIVVPPHLPLEEIAVSTTSSGGNDDDDDLSSISMEDEIDALAGATATSTPSRPRSIFSHRAKPACADVVDRPSSPACVMMNMSSSSLPVVRSRIRSNKYSSKTYQYSYDGDVNPYEHFGIAQDYYGDEDEQQEQQKKEQQPWQESDSSLNTYERMISGAQSTKRNNKNKNKSSNVFNVWMSFFTKNDGTAATATTRHSAPSLCDLDRQSNKNTRNVQSDSDLIKSPSKSCLRRGRFSSVVVKSPSVDFEAHEDDHDHESSSGHSDRTVVQFETNVQVFEFQRPVESWAENGWSSWFG
eukprot:CAMPEP_0113466556 /NCGR_PEP_ID=MMETSP0014_2-20120614/14334_1 /TAXON_ID=2857 /ORGANISM="Nitzschia sp." /LENGTH=322 /DNA_ID=CAMNT_0000358785 /DNA_START=135 /DNA_END=1103 /DNA_ORIENTATION=- /assembly_acc=CAM_ASM_000159